MGDSSELRARLAANAQRQKRVAAAEYMRSFGALVADVSDRFAVHWNDDVEAELMAWIRENLPFHGPYADRRSYREGPDGDLPAVLADMVAQHGLSGWVDMVSGLGHHDVAVSVEATSIPVVVPHLRAHTEDGFDDTLIVSRMRTFALMAHHEGTVDMWIFGPPAPDPSR